MCSLSVEPHCRSRIPLFSEHLNDFEDVICTMRCDQASAIDGGFGSCYAGRLADTLSSGRPHRPALASAM